MKIMRVLNISNHTLMLKICAESFPVSAAQGTHARSQKIGVFTIFKKIKNGQVTIRIY